MNWKFTVASNIHHAADLINKPHEDYPMRVNVTAYAIETVLKMLPLNTVPEFLIRGIHHAVMH
jgi:hypothetical protein